MKIISSTDVDVRILAQHAIDAGLYQSKDWTLYNCFIDILSDDDIADTSKILMLQDDFGKYIGVVFHNDECSGFYWGTNIQMFIKSEHRGNGYAKMLYRELNKLLISEGFDGMLYAGEGVTGSMTFWSKMEALHQVDENNYLMLAAG